MKTLFPHHLSGRMLFAITVASSLLLGTQAWAQPSSRPLLSNQSGAKPNLMIALDNSGSMAYPFHESYALQYSDNNNNALRYCPSPNHSWDPSEGYVQGGRVVLLGPSGQTCINSSITSWLNTDVSLPYSPALTARNNWFAQRSADVNPVYYNPRTTYSPRLGPDYVALTRPANITFISNQASTNTANAFYQVYRNPTGGALYVVHQQKPEPSPRPSWATPNDTGTNNSGNRVYGLRSYPFPTHAEIANSGSASTPTFDYTYCRSATGASTVETAPDGSEIGCSSVRRTPFATSAAGSRVSVYAPGHPSAAANIIALPADHNRTDCGAGATSCTNQQELNNILNWYQWYSTRQLATSTAIGQALSGTDFQNQLRIGYLPINDYTQSGTGNLAITKNPGIDAPGTATGDVNVLRGVRTLQGGTTASTQLYSFLNSIQSRGGTPLHNAVSKIADYYGVPNGAVENPWSSNPAAPSSTSGNPEMTCRRSFNLLFSDGGWTASYAPTAGPDYDNINGPNSPPFSRVLSDGSTETFRYLRTGDPSVAGRIKYTPYPSSDTGGLADLTARYFWHSDLRPALDNQVQTRPGQPTFWQNMSTYTVGYLIKPTAEVTGGAGLSFNRIDQYKRDYALNGYAGATLPVWPLGNLATTSTNQQRVDDFIHAGFTGGGRSFSATTSEDVRQIFNTIIAEILSASGRDAGVSVSSGSGGNSTLAGRYKYSVSYRTLDNSGDIEARELNAAGTETGVVAWSANALMPTPSARRMYTMSGTNLSTDFLGSFSSLPLDVRTALATGPDAPRIPTNAGFVNYLRGEVAVADNNGKLFRVRESKLASMVNPPSVYMGDSLDYAYDLDGSGGVQGRGSYVDYTNRKRGYPKSLYVATNAGTMHAFNALTGIEMAAFRPRRSLRRMLNFAADPYNFEYVLDGPISENDVFDGAKASSQGLTGSTEWRAWRHLAVGSGGRGERLVYAINSPLKPAALGDPANRIPDRQDFLWETGPDLVNPADGANVTMGYIANYSRTGQTENLTASEASNDQRGRWIVAVNNGHYNGEAGGTKSGLVVLDAITGAVIRTIPLPNGYSAGRGLSGVTLLRSYQSNTRVVAAYAGDANGQLWRFNLTGEPSTWHVSHGRPLFTVPGNRPIFGHPAWQKHSAGGFIVVFATGIVLEENDLDDLGAQSIYGIWDRMELDGTMLNGETFTPVTNAQLEVRNAVTAGSVSANGFQYFGLSGNNINWNTQRGWRLPMLNIAQTDASLRPGERSIADVQNYGSNVVITSTVLRRPASTEMCSASDLPANYIFNLNAQEASPDLSRSFDVDGDGRLDPFAVAYAAGGGFSRGISLTRRYTNSTGTELPVEPVPPPNNTSDPQVPLSDTARLTKAADEASGESMISNGSKPKCRTMRGVVLGTATSGLATGVFCPTTGWNRTQFQLSAPPTN